MGWENCHLHEFRIAGKIYAEPDSEDYHFGRAVLDERRVRLSKLLLATGASSFEYIYDFGDNWQHDIMVESIMRPRLAKRYPVCIAGERSAPPEDVGGMGGYHRYLEALFDPKHDNHRAMLAWRGRFDSEYFPITSVNKKLREAFQVPSRKVHRSAPATFEDDFNSIVRSIIRSGRLPPQKSIRG
jgi:hypothetical protein